MRWSESKHLSLYAQRLTERELLSLPERNWFIRRLGCETAFNFLAEWRKRQFLVLQPWWARELERILDESIGIESPAGCVRWVFFRSNIVNICWLENLSNFDNTSLDHLVLVVAVANPVENDFTVCVGSEGFRVDVFREQRVEVCEVNVASSSILGMVVSLESWLTFVLRGVTRPFDATSVT